MSTTLKVGQFSAAQGKKTAGVQEVQVAGHVVQVPLFLVHGAKAGPTLVITAGVHGAEYASIAAALEIGQTLTPEAVHGSVIVAPVVNMPAFRARSIYVCPLDGKNLNRVFPGNPDGTASEQLAHWLFQNLLKKADYYVDLHGGDLVEALIPFTIYNVSGNEQVDRKSKELAQVFGIPYVVRSETRGSTYSAAAHEGIPSMLAEAGGQGLWPREAVALLTTGVNRLMRHLGMLEGPAPEPIPTLSLDKFIWLRSEHDGYYYLDVNVGDTVRQGQLLGKITDFQGNTLQTVESPADGRILFLVSSLAINKGDPLLAVGA
ncbi:MAG: M14 family metallopeptidase [Anaerolineales bacterium]